MSAKIIETNNDLIKNTTMEKPLLRRMRKPILEAYDRYKVAVCYGDLEVTKEEKEEIHNWYHVLLNTSDTDALLNALQNIPDKVKYYYYGE